MIRFEIRRARWRLRRQWYFRIVAVPNGKILASSETYARRIDAQETVDLIRAWAAEAGVEVEA